MPNLTCYHSCQYCQKFVIDLDRKRPPGNEHHESANGIFFFDATLKDVLEGVSHQCQFCVWLDTAWDEHDGERYRMLSKTRTDRIAICANSYSMSLLDSYPLDELLYIGLWEHDAPVHPASGKCRVRCQSLDILTPKDDPAHQFIWTRPINSRPGSAENLAQARRWLEECLHSHPNCRTEQKSMPSRILRIDTIKAPSEFEVTIEHTHDKVQPFAALSYCWGGDQPYKTTKSRIASESLRLPYEELAKSVQDAIKVALNLGLKYLWVDALCIIQDDENDKIEQIADMPRIYNQAHVTIIAARADRATRGFLDDIDIINTTRLAVKLPFRCPGQHATLGSAYVTFIEDNRESEPIHFRAWTLQERYLSNRCLEFGSHQTRWVCASSRSKDGYCDGWKRDRSDDIPAHAIWQTIIVSYAPRRLSVLTDRILAISGIAQVFGPYLQDKYLAGLWESTLLRSLCWQVTRGEDGCCPRPAIYQGPSWSWVSINGPVNFSRARASDRDCRAVLVDTKVELVSPYAKYGSIRRGTITLKSRLREAIWHRNLTGGLLKLASESNSNIDSAAEETMMESIVMFPDMNDLEEDVKTLKPIDVSLFEISNCIESKRVGSVGLVLHAMPYDTSHSYARFTRLGMFYTRKKPDNQIRGDTGSSREASVASTRRYTELFDEATGRIIEIE
ncbi:heterokaryon incompatibility protein-domain-containing protein [Hypomontagnella monticulosa]|nr:heterokaryon incompatibility protein-domain-containing protein [Hypomontagnella monticulosa]